MSPRARSRPERPPSSPTPWGRPRLGRDIVHLDFVGRGSGLDALLVEPLVAAFVGGFAPQRFDHQIAHAVLARCARIAPEARVEALLPRLTEAAYDFFAIGFPFLAHSPKARAAAAEGIRPAELNAVVPEGGRTPPGVLAGKSGAR